MTKTGMMLHAFVLQWQQWLWVKDVFNLSRIHIQALSTVVFRRLGDQCNIWLLNEMQQLWADQNKISISSLDFAVLLCALSP